MEQKAALLKTDTLFSDARIYLLGGTVLTFLGVLALLAETSLLLPVVAVAGGVALLLLFRAPLFLLGTLVVIRMSLDYSSQFIAFEFFERTFSLSQLLGLGIAGLGALALLLYRREIMAFPLVLPYGLVLLWGATTLLYTLSPAASLQELLRIFDLFTIAFLAFVAVRRYRDYRFLLMAIFVSSVPPIFFGLSQIATGTGLVDENVSAIRIFGTFSHPNVFSLYLFAIAAIAGIYFLVYARKDNARLFTGLFLLLVLGTLFLTYARIAWIALFLFAFFVTVWHFRFLLVPLLLLPVVLITFVPAVQERVNESLHPSADSSVVWRQNLWHDMLLNAKIEQQTLFGSGLDTFRFIADALRGERFGSTDSHNDFVKFYIDGGRIGLGIYGLFLLLFLYPAWQIRRVTPSHSLKYAATLLLFLLLTLMVASLSDNVFKNTPVQWLIAIVYGGLLALYRASLPRDYLTSARF
jgi:putative inorganic carbon (hco3(-)) transporter